MKRMSFEKFNPFNKNTENRYTKKEGEKKKKDDFDPGRRDFLKKSTFLAGSMVMSGTLGKLMKKMIEEQEKEEKIRGAEEKALEEGPFQEPTIEQKKIEKDDITSLAEILDYEKEGDIELTTEIMEAIKDYWKERYRKDPPLRNSLEQAYCQMGRWEPYLKEQFRQAGTPEKFVYLAIPESHWQLQARSGAGAAGPYQFMPKTGRAYGLKMDYFSDHPRNLDERQDPIKASNACARLLKDLYEASGDWNLALSGYNGGYFWRYLKEAKNEKQEISYQGFLSFLESKINKIKKDLKENEYTEYKIKPGDSLNRLADKFGEDKEKICKINNIQDERKIYAGQIINIPISTKNNKKIFERKIKGMAENLSYPPKFNAVHELIQEELIQDREEPVHFQSEKPKSGKSEYTFQKEDKNIYRLSLKLGVTQQEILKANPNLNPNDLTGGEKLTIPGKYVQPTLKSIAEQKNKDLSELASLNPAIKDPEAPIPKEYKIRI
jgi:LysM repeat protein